MKTPYSISLEKVEVAEIKELADKLKLPPRTLARAILIRGLQSEKIKFSSSQSEGIPRVGDPLISPVLSKKNDWKMRSVSKAVLCPNCKKVFLSNIQVEKCKCGASTEPCQIIEIDFVNERNGPGEAVGPISSIKLLDGETVEQGCEKE